MKPKVKTARRKAGKLHGASANYVSIVDRGANETPFTLVKNAEGTKTMAIKKRSKKSHKTVGSGRKAATTEQKTVTEMAKMLFDCDVFADEQAVLAKLQEMDWTVDDIVITKTEDGDFQASLDGVTDDDYIRTEEVETDEDGVYAFVGQRVAASDDETDAESADDEDDEAADDDEPAGEGEETDPLEPVAVETEEAVEASSDKKKKPYAKKEAPKTEKLSKRQEFLAKRAAERQTEKKFDAWDAHFSKGNTLAKALQDGMSYDATPPGYYEVQAAFNAVVGNIVSGEGMPEGSKQEALNKAALDYAEIIGGLDSFFDAYVSADEETVQAAFESENDRAQLEQWAYEYADFQSGETAEAAPVKKTVAKSADDKSSDLTSTVAELISKAVEPLAKQVEAVSGTVESLATRRPSKKAAEPDDGQNGKMQSKKAADAEEDDSSWVRRKQSKSLMG